MLRLANGEQAVARSVVIASGARYRRLALPQMDAIEASSIHYWASPLEGKLCAGQEVALVGAGNSAGQAVVYLASHVAKVWLLVRGASLAASMSSYLVDRIRGLANVEVVLNAEVNGLEGKAGILEAIRWRIRSSGEDALHPIRHLFLFIGADPNTAWLDGAGVALDPKGFVLTGVDTGVDRKTLETSRRGVFAIGDARSGSVKQGRRDSSMTIIAARSPRGQARRRRCRGGSAGGRDAPRRIGQSTTAGRHRPLSRTASNAEPRWTAIVFGAKCPRRAGICHV